MQLVSKKNFIITLAAILVIAMGMMAIVMTIQQLKTAPSAYDASIEKMETQSTSDNLNDIEKDLNETDFSDLDKELDDIEKELES